MAVAAREERQGMRSESIARELEWAVRRRELEHAGEHPRTAVSVKNRNAAKARIRQRAKAAARPRFPVLGILGAALIAGFAVMLLMGYIELTRLSSETVTLKNRMETLRSENVILSAKYDRMFDLATVQEAAEAAGMTKPSGSQIGYLDLSEGDSVVLYRNEEGGMLSHLLLSTRTGFEAVKEFFD